MTLLNTKMYFWFYLYKIDQMKSKVLFLFIYILISIYNITALLQELLSAMLSYYTLSIENKLIDFPYKTQVKIMVYNTVITILFFFLISGFNFNSMESIRVVDSIGYTPYTVDKDRLPLNALDTAFSNRGLVKYILQRPHLIVNKPVKNKQFLSCTNTAATTKEEVYEVDCFEAKIVNVKDTKYQINSTLITALTNKDATIQETENYKDKDLTSLALLGKYEILGRYIKSHESFSPSRYYCLGNYPTIGYGHVIKKNERAKYWDTEITKEEGVLQMISDVLEIEDYLNKLVRLDTMFFTKQVAIIHLCYNIGVGNFSKSTLYKNIKNKGVVSKDNFTTWSLVKGKRIPYLERMRYWEYLMYKKSEELHLYEIKDTVNFDCIRKLYMKEARYNIFTEKDSSLWKQI